MLCFISLPGLIDGGFGHQIVLAHDIAFKSRLTKFGGDGYDYLVRNCVPYMKQIGVTEDQINAMLVETPKRLLTRSK
jgi:phosphotriesterase-related protein